MTSSLHRLNELGQSVWFDNIRRGFIESGELQRLIDLGVTGLTSNPSIFEKAITGSTDYDSALLKLAMGGSSATEIFETLAIEDIRDAADLLRPIYDSTAGADGLASIEVSPHLAGDTEETIAEARRLHAALDRPNVMVKVPATPEGIPAIRRLIGEGISVNVTLIFSLDAYAQVREAYVNGLEEFASGGGNLSEVSSVASFFVSRVDAAVDSQLTAYVDDDSLDMEMLMGKAAISNAKLAYRDFRRTFSEERFSALSSMGARLQRPLWASTSTKNPEYSDVMYVEELVGPDTVNTLPDATLDAFLDHGNPHPSIDHNIEDAVLTMERLEDIGINLEEITDKLLADGVKAFADSYDALIANIEEKRNRLMATDERVSAMLGSYEETVSTVLACLDDSEVPARIWERDHTAWKADPTEISDRLGWLTVTGEMQKRTGELRSFADEIRHEGFKHVVLLGMGGSSLGALALNHLFDSATGYPELIVLDSTIPDTVHSVSDAIDCGKTLFIVASKSGSTIEPNVLYEHFSALTAKAVGAEAAGRHFVAICDAGTSLEHRARNQNFRRVFLNPPDIGGRYSVQSLFGLVPSALTGIDIDELLGRVDDMSRACRESSSARQNPGAWLGAVIGGIAAEGSDKLTLVTSESLKGFGLWVEQLIAESTGKEGKGVIPVVGEPPSKSHLMGDDRLVVYVTLDGDDTHESDAYVDGLENAGIPTVRLLLKDRYDIGAEFFRWEFATAVASSLLGVHPFDQPDVQRAKDITERILHGSAELESSPASPSSGSFSELMEGARPGDYLAVTAFVQPTPEFEKAIARFREEVTQKYGIATTFGYGPRYLHSTGQLHKGGPDTGMFLQVTQVGVQDVNIPGESFTFADLTNAQAKGDLDSLDALGRRVAHVDVGPDDYSALNGLIPH